MSEFVFYIDKKKNKKGEAAERFSFIIAGLTLLLAIYDTLNKPGPVGSFIDYFYLFVSGLAGLLNIIFAVFVNKIKIEKRRILIYRLLLGISGIILITDAINKILQRYHGIQYLLMLAGLLYLTVALFYNEMEKKKYIKVDDEGISFKGSVLNKKRFLWKDIKTIELNRQKISVSLNEPEVFSFKIFSKSDELKEGFRSRLSEELSKRNIKLIEA